MTPSRRKGSGGLLCLSGYDRGGKLHLLSVFFEPVSYSFGHLADPPGDVTVAFISYQFQPKLGCLWIAIGDLNPYRIDGGLATNLSCDRIRHKSAELASATCGPFADGG